MSPAEGAARSVFSAKNLALLACLLGSAADKKVSSDKGGLGVKYSAWPFLYSSANPWCKTSCLFRYLALQRIFAQILHNILLGIVLFTILYRTQGLTYLKRD